jgi:hypothetical protein
MRGGDHSAKDGKKRDSQPVPYAYLQATSMEEGRKTAIDQLALWHTKCAAMLHGVVMVQTHVHTPKTAPVV